MQPHRACVRPPVCGGPGCRLSTAVQGFAHKPPDARARAAPLLCCLALLGGDVRAARLWADAALVAAPASAAALVNKARALPRTPARGLPGTPGPAL
jgi:hypothetical protein